MTGFSSRRRRAIAALGSVLGLMVLTTSGSSAGSWQAKAPMPAARYTHAAATLNGLIHIVGGADLSTCSVLHAHDVYDPVNDAWTSAAPMQVGRAHPSAAVLNDGTNDLLYVVGGASDCGVKAASMEAYDPAANAWTNKAPMPGGGRNSMGAAVIDNRLYVVGGIGTGEALTALGEMYNPITDTWSPIAPMPTVRYAMAIGAIDGILYAAGGGNDIPNFTAVDAYDPATNSWTSKAPLSVVRGYAASTVANGLLYAIGGQPGSLSSVEIYNPVTNTWSAGPALPFARSLMPAANVAGRIYVMGGGYDNAGHIVAETLTLVDSIAPTTTATPSMAANGNGWNNSDVTVTLDATDGVGGTGVQSIAYFLPGSNNIVPGNSVVINFSNEIDATLTYRATDVAGNEEITKALPIKIDKTPPFLPTLSNQTVFATSSAGAVVTFGIPASDTLSGIASTQVTPLSSGMTFPPGTTHVTVTVFDRAGNSTIGGFDVTVNPGDTTPPTTNGNFPAPNANGWNRFNVNINLNANDSGGAAPPSGVQSITYSLSGAQTGGFTVPGSSTSVFVSTEGTTTLTYHATDNRGNVEADHTLTIKLDKTPPSAANLSSITVAATSSAGAVVTFDLAPFDASSGIDSVVFGPGSLPSGSTFPHGTTSENITITDQAGNTTFRNFSVTVNKTLLSIAVTPSTRTISLGQGGGQQFTATGTLYQRSGRDSSRQQRRRRRRRWEPGACRRDVAAAIPVVPQHDRMRQPWVQQPGHHAGCRRGSYDLGEPGDRSGRRRGDAAASEPHARVHSGQRCVRLDRRELDRDAIRGDGHPQRSLEPGQHSGLVGESQSSDRALLLRRGDCQRHRVRDGRRESEPAPVG